MKHSRLIGAAALFLAAACAPAETGSDTGAAQMQQASTGLTVNESPDMAIVANAGLKWDDITPEGFNPGMKIAAIHGDPAAAGSSYTIRLSFPDGYTFPAHYHPNSENLTVLSGTFQLGMGTTPDAAALKTYKTGDFLYIPGEMPHFGGAKGATVIQLHGIGPFEIKLAQPGA